MSRRLLAVATLLCSFEVLSGTAGAQGTSDHPMLASATKSCSSFSYTSHAAHTTYRFSGLKISGAPCSRIKKVVLGYFHSKGKPAGSSPTDGYLVYGWNVLILSGTVDGSHGNAHFSGKYS